MNYDFKKPTMILDIDGTMSHHIDKKRIIVDENNQKRNMGYGDAEIKPGAKERVSQMLDAGYQVVFLTARNMQTRGHNEGWVIAKQGKFTTDWMARNEIRYHGIRFGKPNAHITISAKTLRFVDWESMTIERIKGAMTALQNGEYLTEFVTPDSDIHPTKFSEKQDLRICIHLDGVIRNGDDVISGARERLLELKERGHRIIISTGRGLGSGFEPREETLQQWLKTNEIYYDELFVEQPEGLGIDDRTLTFLGNWEDFSVELIEKSAREK